MRDFSETEKKHLKKLYNIHLKNIEDNNPISALENLGVWHFFNELTYEANVVFDEVAKVVNYDAVVHRKSPRVFEENIINFYHGTSVLIFLLKYLETNQLISIYTLPAISVEPYSTFNNGYSDKDFDTYGHLITSENWSSPDETRNIIPLTFGKENDYLHDIIRKSILLTEELLDFIKNDFKDKEQLRHETNVKLQEDSLRSAVDLGRKSIRIADISLIIAYFSFLATFINFFEEENRGIVIIVAAATTIVLIYLAHLDRKSI